jgi:hypothetical protein
MLPTRVSPAWNMMWPGGSGSESSSASARSAALRAAIPALIYVLLARLSAWPNGTGLVLPVFISGPGR